jgi:outer membrane receptor protein involved in Fe transport
VENFQVGFRGHWLPGADTSVSMFRTRSRDEIFLSGESTLTEFARPTVRHGVQGAVRYEPASWLTVDLQAAALNARFADGANEYIPGAAERIASAAATVRGPTGWSGTLLVNSLGRQGASLAAMGASTFVNAQLARKLSRDTRVSIDVFNILGRPLRDVDYLATTRLWSQPPAGDASLPGPAESRGVRVQFRVRF